MHLFTLHMFGRMYKEWVIMTNCCISVIGWLTHKIQIALQYNEKISSREAERHFRTQTYTGGFSKECDRGLWYWTAIENSHPARNVQGGMNITNKMHMIIWIDNQKIYNLHPFVSSMIHIKNKIPWKTVNKNRKVEICTTGNYENSWVKCCFDRIRNTWKSISSEWYISTMPG